MTSTLSQVPVTTKPSSAFQLHSVEIPVAEKMLRTKRLYRRDGNTLPLNVFIPEPQGQLLYSLTRFIQPARSIEIGMANGISTLYIAQALRDNGRGCHVAIDPYQTSDWQQAGLDSLEQADLADLVSLDERLSHHALPELEQNGLRVQLAFIDGSHLFDYVVADFLNVDRILDVGGIMIFDDSDWPAINAVIRFALANRHYEAFETGVVVEPSRYRPSYAGRLLRRFGNRIPKLGRQLRCDFLEPAHELGIAGRCVVLKKLAEDDRDNQRRDFVPF